MGVFVAHKGGARAARIGSPCGWMGTTLAAFVFVAVTMGIGPRQPFADDVQAQALELSDHAFAMLNAIDAQSVSTKAGPMLAAAASLAGDAQALSTALGAHDQAAASAAMAAVLSDRGKIDAAANTAGGQYPEQWTSIRQEIAALEKQVSTSPEEAGSLAESPLPSAGPAVRSNTAEIARPSDTLSPSQRHIGAASSLGALTNVRINVIEAKRVMSAPGTVEVVGQIVGPRVRRAGVYVNGRLARPIAISTGGYSAFDLTFRLPPGSAATIRAYGNGSDFVEASLVR